MRGSRWPRDDIIGRMSQRGGGMLSRRKGMFGLAVLMALPIAADEAYRFLMQLYLKGLGASPLVIALGTSLCWLGIFVGSALWGGLSDRRAKRALLAVLLIGGAAMMLSMTTLPTTSAALTFVFVRVLFISGVAPIILAIQSNRSSLEDRGRNLSILSAARSVGFALGSMIAGITLERLGFRSAFALLSTLPLLGLLGLVTLEADSPDVRQRPKLKNSVPWSLPLLCLYAGVVLRQMGNTGTRSLIYVFMATLGIGTATMGALNAVNPLVQILAMLGFGWLADRIGRRQIFLLGFALSVVSTALFAVSSGIMGMAIAYSIIGIAFPALFVGSTAFIGDTVSSDRQGAMIGLFESSRGLGGVLGPLLAGLLVPVLGFRGMIGVMAGCAAVGFVIVLLGTRTVAQRGPGVG